MYNAFLGKSTLAKMLLRMLDFDQGALLINNEDIRRLDPPEYHRKLAVVLQDFSKYHNSTLQENIGKFILSARFSCPSHLLAL